MARRWFVTLAAFWLAWCTPAALAANNGATAGYYQAESTKPFQDVVDDLKLAISEKNFRLTGHNQLGKAIRERDGEPFPDYDVLQFCSLSYAKEFLKIDPDAIRYMPCTVAVYSRGGKVAVVAHTLPTDSANPRLNQFGEKMNGILKEIIDYAVGR